MAQSEMPPPGAHFDPPPDLAQRRPPIVSLHSTWFRLHPKDHGALFFGRTGNGRFDAPGGEYGVLYAADSPHCAFVETYGRIDSGYPVITQASLKLRCLSEITSSRPLRLVDITGSGLARLGADNRLSTGDYRVAQHWSAALRNHPHQPDGLLYLSRHDPSRTCLAIFDHASDVIATTSRGDLLDPQHLALLADILDRYGYGLIP